MVATDANLKSMSDHHAPALTSADAGAPGCVAMNGTAAVQMSVTETGSDVVAGQYWLCCTIECSSNHCVSAAHWLGRPDKNKTKKIPRVAFGSSLFKKGLKDLSFERCYKHSPYSACNA